MDDKTRSRIVDMKRAWIVGIVLIALALADVGVMIASHRQPAAPAKADAPEAGQPPAPLKHRIPEARLLAKFEKMAEEACRCTRRRGLGEAVAKDCWAGFEKAVAPFAPTETFTMCMTDTSSLCFGMTDEFPIHADSVKCISLTRSTSAACNADEQRIADAIWARAHRGANTPAERERADQTGSAEIAKAMRALDRGEQFAAPKLPKSSEVSGGCS